MENYVHTIITPKAGAFIMPVILTCLMAALTIALIGVMYYMTHTKISVGTPKAGAFIMPVILTCLMAALTIALIGVMYYMTHTKISVGDGFLSVKTMFYGRKIPLIEIDVDGVKKLNLRDESGKDYRITLRTNGIGLSGYKAGWMRLSNGRKALVYITDRTSVALLPTAKFDVLFSTDDFDGLKNALGR